MVRPMLGNDLEEVYGDLPVRGEILWHDVGELREIDLLAFDIVHESRAVGREIGRLTRRYAQDGRSVDRSLLQAAAQSKHELHQSEAAGKGADGRCADRTVILRAVASAKDNGCLLVGIAEGPDAWKQQRFASSLGEKGLAQPSSS